MLLPDGCNQTPERFRGTQIARSPSYLVQVRLPKPNLAIRGGRSGGVRIGIVGRMPPPCETDPTRLAALIVELRRTLRRRSETATKTAGTTNGAGADEHSFAEKEVMRYLASHPGAGTTAIAESLRLRLNTVSGLCSGLVREGLLRRETNPADGRAARFYLSDVSAVHREHKMERRSGRLSRALQRLDPEEQAAIAAAIPALEALVQVLDQPDATPNP